MKESRKKDRSIPPARVALLPLNTEDANAIAAELQTLSDGYLPTGPNGQSRFKFDISKKSWKSVVNPMLDGLAYPFSTHRAYDQKTSAELLRNEESDKDRIAYQTFAIRVIQPTSDQMYRLQSGEVPELHKRYIAQRLNQMNFVGFSTYRDYSLKFYLGRTLAAKKFGLCENNPIQELTVTYNAEDPNATKIEVKNSGALNTKEMDPDGERFLKPQFDTVFVVESELTIDPNLPAAQPEKGLFPLRAAPRVRFELVPDQPNATKQQRRTNKAARKEAKALLKKVTDFHKRILTLKAFPSEETVNRFIGGLGEPHALGLSVNQDTMLTDWIFSRFSPNQHYFETAMAFAVQHPSSDMALFLQLATFTLTLEAEINSELANKLAQHKLPPRLFSKTHESLQKLKTAVTDSRFKGNRTILLQELERISTELSTLETTVTADTTPAQLQAELNKINITVLKEIGNYVANELHNKNITDLYTELSNPGLIARNNEEIAVMINNGLKDPELRPLIGNLFIGKVLRLNDVLPKLSAKTKTDLVLAVFKSIAELERPDFSCFPPIVRDSLTGSNYTNAFRQLDEDVQSRLFSPLMHDRPKDALTWFGTYALENPDLFEQKLVTDALTQAFAAPPKETFVYDFAKASQNKKPGRFSAQKDKTRYETAQEITEIYEIVDSLKNDVNTDQSLQRISQLSYRARAFLLENGDFSRWLSDSTLRARTIQAFTDNLNSSARYSLFELVKKSTTLSEQVKTFATKHITSSILNSAIYKEFVAGTSSRLIDSVTQDTLSKIICLDTQQESQGLSKLIAGASRPMETPWFWERWFPGKIQRENNRIRKQGQTLQSALNYMASYHGTPDAYANLGPEQKTALTQYIDSCAPASKAKLSGFVDTIKDKLALRAGPLAGDAAVAANVQQQVPPVVVDALPSSPHTAILGKLPVPGLLATEIPPAMQPKTSPTSEKRERRRQKASQIKGNLKDSPATSTTSSPSEEKGRAAEGEGKLKPRDVFGIKSGSGK